MRVCVSVCVSVSVCVCVLKYDSLRIRALTMPRVLQDLHTNTQHVQAAMSACAEANHPRLAIETITCMPQARCAGQGGLQSYSRFDSLFDFLGRQHTRHIAQDARVGCPRALHQQGTPRRRCPYGCSCHKERSACCGMKPGVPTLTFLKESDGPIFLSLKSSTTAWKERQRRTKEMRHTYWSQAIGAFLAASWVVKVGP